MLPSNMQHFGFYLAKTKFNFACSIIVWNLAPSHYKQNSIFGCVGSKNSVFWNIFIVVTLKTVVYWDITPCGSSKNRLFGRIYRLHLQSDNTLSLSSSQRVYNSLPPPSWYILNAS
jgi:hypothetical protein